MIAYEGPSELDGSPIVAIITGANGRPSANPKTGPMAQLWIMRSDVHPAEAIEFGLDSAVCGDCPLKGAKCYVNPVWGVGAVYKAFKRGAYSLMTEDPLPPLRLGAYGDPGALPRSVLTFLTGLTPRWTGYTHQWRKFPHLRRTCMASVDTEAERLEATAQGWRTFGVLHPDASEPAPGTIWCPATPEGGNRTNCYKCGLCNGAGAAKSISIRAHGAGSAHWKE